MVGRTPKGGELGPLGLTAFTRAERLRVNVRQLRLTPDQCLDTGMPSVTSTRSVVVADAWAVQPLSEVSTRHTLPL